MLPKNNQNILKLKFLLFYAFLQKTQPFFQYFWGKTKEKFKKCIITGKRNVQRRKTVFGHGECENPVKIRSGNPAVPDGCWRCIPQPFPGLFHWEWSAAPSGSGLRRLPWYPGKHNPPDIPSASSARWDGSS